MEEQEQTLKDLRVALKEIDVMRCVKDISETSRSSL